MDEFEQAALRFFEALANNDQGEANRQLGAMRDRIARAVQRVANAWPAVFYRQRHLEPSDLVQYVIVRLLERPPTERPDSAQRAASRLLCWVNVTTHNRLTDLSRRRGTEPLEEPTETEDPDAPRPDEGVELRDQQHQMDRIEEILAQEYPAGLRLLEVERAEPDLSGEEQAERLGTSRANVYQIRRRRMRLLAERLSDR